MKNSITVNLLNRKKDFQLDFSYIKNLSANTEITIDEYIELKTLDNPFEFTFKNKNGLLNFDEYGEEFPIDIFESKFEFTDSIPLIDDEFIVGKVELIGQFISKIINWSGEKRMVISAPLHVMDYAKRWSALTNVEISIQQVDFSPIEKITKHDMTEFAKKKFGDVKWKSFQIYKQPWLSREKIDISQEEIINSIYDNSIKALNGKKYQDHFITAPTGTGKSLMFQSVAHKLAQDGFLTIVVSPLIALMKDQVNSYKEVFDEVATINSETSFSERIEIIDKIKSGSVSVVYISPETLLSNSYERMFSDRKLGLLVIDEAHIATTWGKGFRPDYWYLDTWIKRLRKDGQKFQIATFTATASYHKNNPSAMNNETISNLDMNDPIEVIAPAYRKDISYDIKNIGDKINREVYVENKNKDILNLIKGNRDKKILIYFPYTSQITEISHLLTNNEVKHSTYFGSLDKYEKSQSFIDYKSGDSKVMLATKAFGMGIDISDIEIVAHYAPTGTINDYLQEIGRAARDEDIKGTAHYLSIIPTEGVGESDLKYINQLHGMSAIRNPEISRIANAVLGNFRANKKRNMLIPFENFTNLSVEEDSVISRLKTAFLMLQRDLEGKYKFKPVIFRPSGVFTELLCKKIKDKTKFDKFAKEYKDDLYTVNVEKIWENYFPTLTFPQFKFYIFATNDRLKRMKVSEEVISKIKEFKLSYNPRQLIKFNVDFKEAIDKTYHKIKEIHRELTLDTIEFTDKEAMNVSKKHGINGLIFIDFLESFMTYEQFLNNRSDSLSFVRSVTKNSSRNSYQIKGSNPFHGIYMELKSLLDSMNNNEVVLPILIDNKSSYQARIMAIKIFEIFDYYSSDMVSGTVPKVFVRLNFAPALERAADISYDNVYVRNASRKFAESKLDLINFFTKDMNDEERRLFIEDIFLMKEKELT